MKLSPLSRRLSPGGYGVVLLALWLVGCTQQPVQTPEYTGTSAQCDDSSSSGSTLLLTQDPPTYDDDIADLIDSDCLSCHDDGDQPPFLHNWQEVESVKSAIVREVVDDQTMPMAGPLSDSDQDLYQAWKDAGYPENIDDLDSGSGDDDDDDNDRDSDSDRDSDDDDDRNSGDDDDDDDDRNSSSGRASNRTSNSGC